MVFIETEMFSSLVNKYLSDNEYNELQNFLMRHPDAGKIMRGGGGIRKMRWARNGVGKSGGIRAIYYWAKSKDEIYMLAIYAKSEKENIDNKTLTKIVKLLGDIK